MKGRSQFFLALLALYTVAALFLLPFLSITSSQDLEEDLEIDITRIADYDIQVELLDEEKLLKGEQTLTWVNAGGVATSELKFHLYMNAFRSPDTEMMKHLQGWNEADAGWIDITSMSLNDGTDLLPGAVIDQTVMTVALPTPVEPGKRLSISVTFTVKLPKVFLRTGYSDQYFMIGQWFPKIAVFLDGRWVCPQFHYFTEFFSNFGMYRVEITVPKSYQVEATGIRQRARTGTTTKTLVYAANPVHDFAWAASPHFRKTKRTLTYSTPDGPRQLEAHLMVQRDRQHIVEKYFDGLQRALDYFSELYGDYPYPAIKIIDPAPGRGQRSGGMEYPMLITGGSRWFNETFEDGSFFLQSVTAHEFAHQYYHSSIATNEIDEPWLDEGMTAFAQSEVLDSYGPFTDKTNYLTILASEISGLSPYTWQFDFSFDNLTSLMDLGCKRTILRELREGYLPTRNIDPITLLSYRFSTTESYYNGAYYKPALVFHTLEGMLGRETFREFLRQYYLRFKFRHPSGKDFRALLSEIAEEDMEWFFYQFMDTTKELDYRVKSITPGQVVFERVADAEVPQTITVKLKNGKELQFNWPLSTTEESRIWMDEFSNHSQHGAIQYRLKESVDKRWYSVELKGDSSIVSAQIDPEYIYKLDTNYANNSAVIEPDGSFANKTSLKWIRLISRWLHGASIFN